MKKTTMFAPSAPQVTAMPAEGNPQHVLVTAHKNHLAKEHGFAAHPVHKDTFQKTIPLAKLKSAETQALFKNFADVERLFDVAARQCEAALARVEAEAIGPGFGRGQ